MKIAILSREPKSYSTKRLREACIARGHKVKVLNTLSFSVHAEQGNPSLFYKNKLSENFDAVIPRIGSSITFFGTAVVRQFEQMGVFCLNNSLAISMSRDKLKAIQVLSRHSLGMPTTVFVKKREDILPAIEEIGGAPVVVKLLEGTQGVGVILAETNKVAEAIIETLQSAQQNVLIQKFVKESKGRDIRAIVVGGRVVAAMRRVAQGDEFRSNVHRGGKVESIKLDEKFEQTAIRAAQVMGLHCAGVDMLEGEHGPMLMEVNSSPGLQGIEQASKIDVADAIVEYLENQVLFPEVDIRQRLSIQSGYGVAEVDVPATSILKDKTIAETGLRDLDISVLSVIRGSVAIPNPRGSRKILAGDKLLCFGKLGAIKDLIPKKKRRIKRKRLS